MSRQNTSSNKMARRSARVVQKRKASARLKAAGQQPGIVLVTRRLVRQHLYRAIRGLEHHERVASIGKVLTTPWVEVGKALV